MEHGTRPEMIAEAQAQVDAAAAEVNAAQLAVEWCTIRSPIDGTVVQLTARQGQFIDRAISLATVTDLLSLFVQLRIPSDALANVQIGTQVEVHVTGFPDESFAGQVTRRSGEADSSSGDLNMYVTIKNAKGQLRPGLSCRAVVSLPPIANALTVPISAIADHNGSTVVTVVRDGKAQETTVTTGVQAGGRIQIVSGLSNGDVVATKGGYGLPEGYPVEQVANPSGS
jgi:RND family efflux transporter MFP subunit